MMYGRFRLSLFVREGKLERMIKEVERSIMGETKGKITKNRKNEPMEYLFHL